MPKQARAIWPLLKVRVIAKTDNGVSLHIGAEHGSPTTLRLAVDTRGYDIREGDLLTLYTEVILKEAKGES